MRLTHITAHSTYLANHEDPKSSNNSNCTELTMAYDTSSGCIPEPIREQSLYRGGEPLVVMVRIARRHHGHGHGHLSCWRSLHGLQGRWWQRGDGSCTPAAISHDDEGDSELVKNEGTTKSIMIHDEDDIHPRKSERWTAEIKKNTRIQCGCGTLLVTPLPQLQLGHGCMSQGMSIR